MRKQVLYGKEARQKVLAGVNKIADAVVTTLGPAGRNVLISQSMVVDYGVHNLPIYVTKDGYNTTKAFELDEPFEQAGVLMAKECAQKTVDISGDGTSTSILLLRAIVSKGVELIDNGTNPIELKIDIEKAVEYVVSELKNMAVPIKGDIEKIRQIAYVSANNDSSIGDLIAEAFEKIGDEGMIDIEPSKSVNTEIKLSDGYKVNKGWISPRFINNNEKQLCEFTDPLILLYEKRITHHTQIEKAVSLAMQKGKPILIFCEDAEDEGFAFLALNNFQKRIQCCVVTSSLVGAARIEEMEDLALLTGATYICDSKGKGIKEVEIDNLGSAKKVTVSKNETAIIGGKGNKKIIINQLNELRMNLAEAKSEDDKNPIEKRIARLTGSVAVIQVGATTDTEMKEKMDRVDDAVRATKAAIAEGSLPGGGTSFIRVDASKIKSILIKEAIIQPILQICKNAGVDGNEIYSKVSKLKGNMGYNAKTNEIEDLAKSGIIDPAKVLRCALQNAASTAIMILTSECLIVDTL